jgi:hypothetical protein
MKGRGPMLYISGSYLLGKFLVDFLSVPTSLLDIEV